jgi:DNA-binding response OmpR family regulator
LLALAGHDASMAGSVKEGLELLDAGNPSRVLLDMDLPDGSGTAVLRHIRQYRLPVKVAVLSATTDPSILCEARALAPDAMFTKPAEWDKVLEWIAAE